MQDARMLLPGGARGRVLLRAGHQRLERLEERLDAHPRALPGLQERWRQGGRGQRHPGAPPLQSHRPLFKGWPFAREGSREDQESPRGGDPPQQCPDREHRGGEIRRRRHRRGVASGRGTEPEAEAATPKPKKTKKAPEWKSLPDAEKAQYLLDHQTISDRTWTKEPRLKGEKRDAFIHRILRYPKTPERGSRWATVLNSGGKPERVPGRERRDTSSGGARWWRLVGPRRHP